MNFQQPRQSGVGKLVCVFSLYICVNGNRLIVSFLFGRLTLHSVVLLGLRGSANQYSTCWESEINSWYKRVESLGWEVRATVRMIAMEMCDRARMVVCGPRTELLELDQRRVRLFKPRFSRISLRSGLMFGNQKRCGALQYRRGEGAETERITAPIDVSTWEVNTFEEQVSGIQGTRKVMEKLKIGIVGFGNFGQFLAERFCRHGHRVVAFSRSDYNDVAHRMGVSFHRYVAYLMPIYLPLPRKLETHRQSHLLFNLFEYCVEHLMLYSKQCYILIQ